MGSIDLLVAALFAAGADAAAIAAGVLVPATLPLTLNPGLVFERLDLWPVFLLLLAVVGSRTRAPAARPCGLEHRSRCQVVPVGARPARDSCPARSCPLRRDVAIATAVGLAFLLPFGAIAPRGLGHVGSLLTHRPLQSESLVPRSCSRRTGSASTRPTTYLSIGNSWDLAGLAAKVVPVVTSLAGAAALVACGSCSHAVVADTASCFWPSRPSWSRSSPFGKIFSTQYMLWVAFAAPLALGRTRPFVLSATVSATLLALYVYDAGSFDLIAGGRTSWVLLTRNLILVGLGLLLVELATRGRGREVRAGLENP